MPIQQTRQMIAVCAQPRSGSNMLCDLVSQVGYENHAEYFSPGMNVSELQKMTGGRLPAAAFLRCQKVVVKIPLGMAEAVCDVLACHFNIRPVCVYRPNAVQQAISLLLAQITGKYAHVSGSVGDRFWQVGFPRALCAFGDAEKKQETQIRGKLLEDDRFAEKAACASLHIMSGCVSFFLGAVAQFEGIFQDTLRVNFDDLVANPGAQIERITGTKKPGARPCTERQSDSLNHRIYEQALLRMTAEETTWFTGGWVQWLGAHEVPQVSSFIDRVPVVTVGDLTKENGV